MEDVNNEINKEKKKVFFTFFMAFQIRTFITSIRALRYAITHIVNSNTLAAIYTLELIMMTRVF